MCAQEEFLAIGDAEFVKDVGEVMADRNAGNTQAVGNVFI